MASATTERIYRLTVDATAAVNKLDQIAKSTGAVEQKMTAAGKSMGSFINVAAVTSLALYAKGLFDAADAASDLGDAFGITIGKVYAFQNAVSEAGGKGENFQQMMQKVANSVDDAFGGNDKAVESFARLGITMESMKDQNLDQIYERIAKALAGIADPAKRNAIAMDLMGKAAIGTDWEKHNRVLGETRDTYEKLSPALQRAADYSEMLTNAIKKFSTVATAALGAIPDTIAKIGDGFRDIYAVVTGGKSLDEAMTKTAVAAEATVAPINRVAQATQAQTKAMSDAQREAEKWNSVIAKQVEQQIAWEQKLKDSLNPMNEIDRELAKLQVALDSGRISWEQYADGMFLITDKIDGLKQVKEPLDEIGVAIGNTLASGVSSLIDSFDQAGASFGKMAADFLKNIAKMIAQMFILKAIQNSMKGTAAGAFFGFAKGGNFAGGTGLPHGVYDQPTFFKFANGGTFGSRTGVLGEAGAEAILPLKKNSQGKLGVSGGGGVSVVINNNAPVEVSQSSTTGADGQTTINIMIEKKVKDLLAGGGLDKQMRSAYGLNRQAA